MKTIKGNDFDHKAYLENTRIAFGNTRDKDTYTKYLKPIVNHLVLGLRLTYDLQQWINGKRIRHVNNGDLSPALFEALEQLIPLLGYDWKVQQHVSLSFEEWVEEITTLLDSEASIVKYGRQHNWLLKQRKLYHDQTESKPFPKQRQEALDALIPKLGYDWKVYVNKK